MRHRLPLPSAAPTLRRLTLAALLALGCNNSGIVGGEADLSIAPDLLPPAPPPDLTVTASGIGAACTGMGGTDPGSCAPGQHCIPDGTFGFTGGYCTADCSSSACPADAACVMLGPIADCFLLCRSDADCRASDGYTCQAVGPGQEACLPLSGDPNAAGVRPGTRDGGACVQPVVMPGPAALRDGGVFGINQQVSPGENGGFEAEGELAVDPKNQDVVVAYNRLAAPGAIGFVRSLDDGMTWGNEGLLPADNRVDYDQEQSDPVVAVDGSGNFYVSWVGFNRDAGGNPVRMNIWCARSVMGGPALDQIVQVSPNGEAGGGELDKPWIFASPLDGSLWMTWDRIGASTEIRMTRSTDGGRTWTAPVSINDPNKRAAYDRNLAQIYIPDDGRAAIAWVEIGQQQFGATSNGVYLMRFNPDGTPLTPSNVKVTAPPDSPAFEDPSVTAFGDAVYVGFISGTASGAWDVRVAASIDSGKTFQPSVKANDDPTCATHYHQQIAVDGRGNVHAIFYDNRYLAANVFWTMSGPADAHNALAFGTNQFVNDVPFTFTTRRDMSNWLGDYLGLWIRGDALYATWSDNRTTNNSHLFFAKGRVPR